MGQHGRAMDHPVDRFGGHYTIQCDAIANIDIPLEKVRMFEFVGTNVDADTAVTRLQNLPL